MDRHPDRHGRPPAGIGAGVEIAIEVQPADPPVGIDPGPPGHPRRVALGGRGHAVAAAVDDPRRPSGLQRHQPDQRLHREVELGAEAAAGGRGDDPHPLGRQTQHPRGVVAVHHRRLGAGADHEGLALQPGGAGLGLDIGVLDEGGLDPRLGEVRGPGQRRLHVAAAHRAGDEDVALAPVMETRRGFGAGDGDVRKIGNRLPGHRERLKIERLDMLGRAGDQCHRLAAHPHMGLGQNRLIGKARQRAKEVLAGDIGGGEDLHRPGQPGAPGRDIAETEARGGMGRADHPHQQRALGDQIGAEPLASRDLLRPVQPLGPGAHRGAGGRALGPALPRRVQHRGDDLGIAGAAAQHAPQRLLDLGPRRGGIDPQQGAGRHQHPRRADPALRRAVTQESPLQVRQGVLPGQPLDGDHVAPGRARQRRQAGADRLPVEQHGAGAAVAGIAADLGAGQPQLAAQHLREPPARCGIDPREAAVDGQFEGMGVLHGAAPAARSASARRSSSVAAALR